MLGRGAPVSLRISPPASCPPAVRRLGAVAGSVSAWPSECGPGSLGPAEIDNANAAPGADASGRGGKARSVLVDAGLLLVRSGLGEQCHGPWHAVAADGVAPILTEVQGRSHERFTAGNADRADLLLGTGPDIEDPGAPPLAVGV